MAHDKCLAKCPSNCDCIKDDIAELKRIKKISFIQIVKILEEFSSLPGYDGRQIIHEICFKDIAE
jgi:Fe-S oxidoreductase